jgi:hypothetical protein
MKIPCAHYRGGTSKPVFFLEKDLPVDPKKRDQLVLGVFGSPDVRQIDGLGGADPLTSKVAYIGPPTVRGTDINYTFGYVGIAQPVIDYTGNCGNTSAAVGPFALLRGLIEPKEPVTRVRIYNTNTKKIIVAEFPVRDGEFVSEGNFSIDGVPGTGSKILLDFLDSGGSVTGKLLPTGKVREEIKFPTLGTLTVSMVDAANPFVFVRAGDLGVKGNESMDEIAGNAVLRRGRDHGHRQTGRGDAEESGSSQDRFRLSARKLPDAERHGGGFRRGHRGAHDRAAEASQGLRSHRSGLFGRRGQDRRNDRQRNLPGGQAGQSSGGAHRPSLGDLAGRDGSRQEKRRDRVDQVRARAHRAAYNGRFSLCPG